MRMLSSLEKVYNAILRVEAASHQGEAGFYFIV